MKKLCLSVVVLLVFGCGRSSIPSDDIVKGCMLGRYYSGVKSTVLLGLMYPGYKVKPLDQESALQQASEILPDSVDYVRKNWDKVQIVSIVKEEKGKCVAEVKYQADKTGNEPFDLGQSMVTLANTVTGYKLSFTFDERQHKWLLENATPSEVDLQKYK